MAEKRDYYEILGISRDCSAVELKSAYRKMAIKYHPDRNPGNKEAEEAFKTAAEAYSILSDPEKRAQYDRFGHAGVAGQGFGGFSGFEDIFSHFSDIFGEAFGFGGGWSRRGMAGADLRYDLEIDLETAVFGEEVELTVPRLKVCPSCSGSGAAPGTEPQPCPTCRGRGQVYTTQGFFRVSTTCPDCQGRGRVVLKLCPECRGHGRREDKSRVKVRIPAGVDDGSRLRLRGEGEDGLEGGPPGDLYVVLRVKEHKEFQRHGDDLVHRLNISMARAALGLETEVPVIDGSRVELKVPPGTQPGQLFRVKGQGVPRLRGRGRGDLVVQVMVETPTNLDARQRELLEELARLEEEKAGKHGLFDRLKPKKAPRKKEAKWA